MTAARGFLAQGIALASLTGFALTLTGCPVPPGNGNSNANGNSNGNVNENASGNGNANINGVVVDAALVGAWYNATTREGLEFSATGELNYLDVGVQGELRRMPALSYRGFTQTVTSATNGILETRAEERLRYVQDEHRNLVLRGTFDTRDEYAFSDDGQRLVIFTDLYGVDDGVARDVLYRKAALGEVVGRPHDMFFGGESGEYSMDSQVVRVDADGRLIAYGEASSLVTATIRVLNAVGAYPLTPGGADGVEMTLLVSPRAIAPFETMSGTVTVTEVTVTETAGTIDATIRSRADRSDVRVMTGSFRVAR